MNRIIWSVSPAFLGGFFPGLFRTEPWRRVQLERFTGSLLPEELLFTRAPHRFFVVATGARIQQVEV